MNARRASCSYGAVYERHRHPWVAIIHTTDMEHSP
jgi:hypothetical protein